MGLYREIIRPDFIKPRRSGSYAVIPPRELADLPDGTGSEPESCCDPGKIPRSVMIAEGMYQTDLYRDGGPNMIMVNIDNPCPWPAMPGMNGTDVIACRKCL